MEQQAKKKNGSKQGKNSLVGRNAHLFDDKSDGNDIAKSFN